MPDLSEEKIKEALNKIDFNSIEIRMFDYYLRQPIVPKTMLWQEDKGVTTSNFKVISCYSPVIHNPKFNIIHYDFGYYRPKKKNITNPNGLIVSLVAVVLLVTACFTVLN